MGEAVVALPAERQRAAGALHAHEEGEVGIGGDGRMQLGAEHHRPVSAQRRELLDGCADLVRVAFLDGLLRLFQSLFDRKRKLRIL